MRPFFVYGTLLPKQPNFHLWQDAIKHIEPATMWAATLFDMGGYPMLMEGHDTVVRGALVEVEPAAYAATLAQLDVLESYDDNARNQSVYLREPRQVQLDDGSQVVAWVYLGKKRYVAGLEPFGGDWVGYSAENHQQINDWWQKYHAAPHASLVSKTASLAKSAY